MVGILACTLDTPLGSLGASSIRKVFANDFILQLQFLEILMVLKLRVPQIGFMLMKVCMWLHHLLMPVSAAMINSAATQLHHYITKKR